VGSWAGDAGQKRSSPLNCPRIFVMQGFIGRAMGADMRPTETRCSARRVPCEISLRSIDNQHSHPQSADWSIVPWRWESRGGRLGLKFDAKTEGGVSPEKDGPLIRRALPAGPIAPLSTSSRSDVVYTRYARVVDHCNTTFNALLAILGSADQNTWCGMDIGSPSKTVVCHSM